MAIQYSLPKNWIQYDPLAILNELTDAKAAILSLDNTPYQRSWAAELQEMELKREVAGTSRIEGAEFTEREFEKAVASDAPQQQFTRSQKQAQAAIKAYHWIAELPSSRSINEKLIREIHRWMVLGCDDDHCPPGQLRGSEQNVTLGRPRHRGVEGGVNCQEALQQLTAAFNREFRGHDILVQALALHYHIGAMHPFLDGNGRTARAVEALILQRARLTDTLFVSMSNYYYDEKDRYLDCLSDARQKNHDLTAFLKFGLHGIAHQCQRMLREIAVQVQRSLFRDVMRQMYGRLHSTRKRALALRQCEILNRLLDRDREIELDELYDLLTKQYYGLKMPYKAYLRDLSHLLEVRAIEIRALRSEEADYRTLFATARLDWATEITETEFYQVIKRLPKAKTSSLWPT